MTGANWDDLTILTMLGVPYVVTQLKNIFRRDKPVEASPDECRCKHASVFHDVTGCRKIVTVPVKWDEDFVESKWERRECECLRYVGPHSSYVPELDGLPPAIEKEDARD